MSIMEQPVKCRHPKGWTVWMIMRPARGMRNWVDVEAYRVMRNGEKRYGMMTVPVSDITEKDGIISLGGMEFRVLE